MQYVSDYSDHVADLPIVRQFTRSPRFERESLSCLTLYPRSFLACFPLAFSLGALLCRFGLPPACDLTDICESLPCSVRSVQSVSADQFELYRTWLAEAYAEGGQFDAAEHTLALVEGDAGSDRVERRVREVARLVSNR